MNKMIKSLTEKYSFRSQGEAAFANLHLVQKHADRNGNGDDVFNGNVPKDKSRKADKNTVDTTAVTKPVPPKGQNVHQQWGAEPEAALTQPTRTEAVSDADKHDLRTSLGVTPKRADGSVKGHTKSWMKVAYKAKAGSNTPDSLGGSTHERKNALKVAKVLTGIADRNNPHSDMEIHNKYTNKTQDYHPNRYAIKNRIYNNARKVVAKEDADETVTIEFDNGDTVDIPITVADAIQEVFEALSEDNQEMFMHLVYESEDSFEKILDFVEKQQLDEVSKATLGSYIKGAAQDLKWQSRDVGHMQAAGSGGGYFTAKRKVGNRQTGINTAADKLMKKEDIMEGEPVNELSKKTMHTYVNKASRDIDDNVNVVQAMDGNSKPKSKYLSVIAKRTNGIRKANNKIEHK